MANPHIRPYTNLYANLHTCGAGILSPVSQMLFSSLLPSIRLTLLVLLQGSPRQQAQHTVSPPGCDECKLTRFHDDTPVFRRPVSAMTRIDVSHRWVSVLS